MGRSHHAAVLEPDAGFVVSVRLKLALIVAVLLASLGMAAALSVATAQAAGRFGVALHPAAEVPNAADFARMDRGKVGSVRVQFYWPRIQKTRSDCSATSTPSACDWSEPDQIVGEAAARGMHVLPFFYGTPHWLRPEGSTDASSPVASPEAQKKWKEFVKAAAQRYGPGGAFWDAYANPAPPIRTWQIWNEQNSKSKWAPRPSPKAYSKLLKLAHTAITSVDRKAKLMLGGMFGTPFNTRSSTAWKFLDRLYDVKGIKTKFDQVAVHPYSPNLRGIKYQMDKMRKVMKANGDRRTKLAVTEIGWGSGKPYHNSFLLKGLEGQKKMLQKSFGLFNARRRDWKLGTVYWFSMIDAANCGDSCTYWDTSSGLFRAGESVDPKPAWRAFTKFTGGRP